MGSDIVGDNTQGEWFQIVIIYIFRQFIFMRKLNEN